MKFEARTIKGKGRGKGLGFPTINLLIPEQFPLVVSTGIYAAWVTVKDTRYPGALFFGPTPVFGEKEKSLEIYLINTTLFYLGAGEMVAFEIVKFIRPVMDFSSVELMLLQIEKDVVAVKEALGVV